MHEHLNLQHPHKSCKARNEHWRLHVCLHHNLHILRIKENLKRIQRHLTTTDSVISLYSVLSTAAEYWLNYRPMNKKHSHTNYGRILLGTVTRGDVGGGTLPPLDLIPVYPSSADYCYSILPYSILYFINLYQFLIYLHVGSLQSLTLNLGHTALINVFLSSNVVLKCFFGGIVQVWGQHWGEREKEVEHNIIPRFRFCRFRPHLYRENLSEKKGHLPTQATLGDQTFLTLP